MKRIRLAIVAAALAGAMVNVAAWQMDDLAQVPRPTFRSGVEMVRVTAVVEDARGRPVLGLAQADFELLVSGIERPIVEFGSEATQLTLAILVDGSGSMQVPPKQKLVRDAILHVLSWITAGEDEVALYAFDRRLSVVEPFTTAPEQVARHVPDLTAFGQTSLYDAIAETSKRVSAKRRARGAVVVVTDGTDTSSTLGALAVARLVSAIDVPVYILALAPGEAPDEDARHRQEPHDELPTLDDLASSTGGRLFVVHGPASASFAARTMVSELRHQYLIGFEPHVRNGWHPLVIRTRQKSWTVRARRGFYADPPVGSP